MTALTAGAQLPGCRRYQGPETKGITWSHGGSLAVDCPDCGYRHLVGMPRDEDLKRFYAEQFYSTAKPKYLEEEREDAPWHRLQFRDRWSHVLSISGHKPRAVLEIGCGSGLFLEFLSKQEGVYHAVGVEPSSRGRLSTVERGLTVFEHRDAILLQSVYHFDLIVAQFVLEHVLDPAALLEFIRGRLSPGGVLYVAVPNDFTLVQAEAADKIGRPEYWVHTPDHVNYFDFESLERLLTKTGFRPVLRDTTFEMAGHLLNGDNYIADAGLGRKLHRERVRYELALDAVCPEARREMMASLAEKGWGRDALIYCTRG